MSFSEMWMDLQSGCVFMWVQVYVYVCACLHVHVEARGRPSILLDKIALSLAEILVIRLG